jgi:cytochrome P450
MQKFLPSTSASISLTCLRFQWYNLITFDVIGDLTFGESFDGLETSRLSAWIVMLFGAIKIFPFIRLAQKFPFTGKILPLIIPKHLFEQRKKHRAYTRAAVTKRANNIEQHGRGDFMDGMLKHRGEKDKITEDELETNSEVLIVTGSEIMATLLSGVTY